MLISCKTTSENDEKTILRYNSPTGITSLDPAYARTQENIRAVNQLFNGLVQLDSELTIQPAIAKSWTISEDGKTYTFVIRNDVLFHNDMVFKGAKRHVTAQDFKYSFGRIISPKIASDGAWIFNGIVNGQESFLAQNDTTFIIKLNKPFAPLLSMLSMAYCYVVPEDAVKHYGSDFGKHPVGTGPFKFSNWHPNIKLNLIKNEQYFESTNSHPVPMIDAISVSFIQSKQTELLEFTQGKLDLFTGLESSFKDEILTSNGELKDKYRDNFELQVSPFLNTEYLAFNLEKESSPVQNAHFRKAIHHAIHRESMITYLRNGIGRPASGGFTPIGLPAHRASSVPLYNPALARQYLDSSQVKLSEPLKLSTTPNYLDLCILVQKNCADIGIDIKIDVIPSSLLKQQKSAGDLAFFRSSWIADYPDGENYMACFYGPNKAPNGPNYTRYNNENFNVKYEALLKVVDDEEREKLFSDLELLLNKKQPYVLLFYDESVWISNKKLKGISINPLNHLNLKKTRLKK